MLTREVKLTHLRIDRLGEHPSVLGDILHHLLQRSSLHLLPLQVGEGVRHEVEEDAALTDLLDQQLLTISLVGLLQLRKLHQLPVLTDVEPKKSNQIWIGFACTLHIAQLHMFFFHTDIGTFMEPAGALTSFLLYMAGASIPSSCTFEIHSIFKSMQREKS